MVAQYSFSVSKSVSWRLKRGKEEVSCDAVGHPQFVCPIYTCDPFGRGSSLEWPMWLTAIAHILGGAETQSDTFEATLKQNCVFLCKRRKAEIFAWKYGSCVSSQGYHVHSTAKIFDVGNNNAVRKCDFWPNFDVEIPTHCHRKMLKTTDGAVKRYKMIPCSTLSECSQLICRRTWCQISQPFSGVT